MRIGICISLDEENLKRIDADKRFNIHGRSGIVRLALQEYFEKRERTEYQRTWKEKKREAKQNTEA